MEYDQYIENNEIQTAIFSYCNEFNGVLSKLEELNYDTEEDYTVSYLNKNIYLNMMEFIGLCVYMEEKIDTLAKKYDEDIVQQELDPLRGVIQEITKHLQFPECDMDTVSFLLRVSDLYHGVFEFDNVIHKNKYKSDKGSKLKTMYEDVGTQYKKFGNYLRNTSVDNVVIPIIMKDLEQLMYAVQHSINKDIGTILETFFFKLVVFHRLLLCLKFRVLKSANVNGGFMKFARKKMLDDFDIMDKNFESLMEMKQVKSKKYREIVNKIIDMIEIIHTMNKI